MANCLLDFIEMTECISTELRSQLTSIRELDLQVNNAMDELEKNIEQFFSNIKPLSQEERQKQFSALLNKCETAFVASDDKVKVADRLHDLIEKMIRSLDQNLEKLKEDLLEGDKAYIVEDIERKSQELDELMRIEQEDLLASAQSSSTSKFNHKHTNSDHFNSNQLHNNESTASKTINNLARNSTSHRNSNGTTGNEGQRKRKKRDSSDAPVGRPRKRDRKHLNDSQASSFNQLLVDDDDNTMNSGVNFSDLPLTPDPVASRKSSAFNDILGNDSTGHSKGAIAGNQHHKNLAGVPDKSNGSQQYGAKQTILIPTDASNKKGRMQSIDSNLPLNQNHSTLSSALSSSVTTNSQQMTNSNTNSPISSLPYSWNIWCNPLGNHQQVQHPANTPLISRDETKYCICRQVSYGEMVACDNDECEIEWFHYDCVGITHPPKGKWFCPDCSRKKR